MKSDKTRAKTALITGCSAGVGSACVSKLSALGWNVVATTRSLASLPAYRDTDSVLPVEMDITNDASVHRGVSVGIDAFGAFDAVVNNAAYGIVSVFESVSQPAIQELFEVNVFGAMRIFRAVLPHMRRQRSGVIVNVSSAAGFMGVPMASIYSSSKFALEGFCESISYELLSQNIVVKIVEPGGINGTSFGRNAKSGDIHRTDAIGYSKFCIQANRMFSNMRHGATATAESVADVVVEACTDGTDQLRYLATNDIAETARLRRECSEHAYLTALRAKLPNR